MAFLNYHGLSTFTEQIKAWVGAKLNIKVDKVDGKDLSTNDFTNEHLAKLNNLQIYKTIPAGRLFGDLNNDGKVDTADAALFNEYLAGDLTLDAAQQQVADIDLDGEVTLADATMVTRYSTGDASLAWVPTDSLNNWQYDADIKLYYFDIAVVGITEDSSITLSIVHSLLKTRSSK